MSWNKLRDTYARHGIFLALGAGVSVDSQLPSWKNLLRRLVSDQIGNGEDALFDQFEQRLSLPIIASLLEEHAPDRSAFVEHVRDALYHDFSFYRMDITKSNRRSFVNYVRETNPTLRSVASLCAARNADGRTYRANPSIHGIVTFNLDALLQAYIYSRYEKRLLRTIERPAASRRPGKINIYHMHGFLRFDRKARDLSKEAPDSVVLTEQDYFDFFNEPTSLFNYTFLYLLREYSCLFIGLSMLDDNIRRLLHYSKKERVTAYVREGKEAINRGKVLRHYAILERSGNKQVDEAIEQTLIPLGTNTLWVNSNEEIPERLSQMYEAGGEMWEHVY